MRTIPLRGKKAAGRVALVDDGDYEFASQYRWHVKETAPQGNRKGTGPYALATIQRDGRTTTILMHALITGWPMTDHKDHDGLNNQRSNLRKATRSQNLQNMVGRGSRRWPYKGIDRADRTRKWKAYIRIDGQLRYLGVHPTQEDAARAYDAAAVEAFGEYAYLNFPEGAASQ